ncbi:MAG: glycosyltransferase [Lachnospiraceae bacterium]|nr:glycosyltransferase [Lachnospiraceae bacterium]
MANNNIILSISMMTNGRNPEELSRCIESLSHLRKTVPSELIIVDTGCNSETHQYIKSKADHVVTFTWCDDFAAARNAGLALARGSWFMFLDDDEYFDETSEIESFFSSNDYKNYEAAQYIIRSYFDTEGKTWSDDSLTRLIRRTKELHFHGRIHEYLLPATSLSREKYLKTFAHHYGYANSNSTKKALRNIPMLHEMIAEEKDNIRWPQQLLQEYLSIKEYKKAADLCRTTLESFYDYAISIHSIDYGSFPVGLLLSDWLSNDIDALISDYQWLSQTIPDYLKIANSNEVTPVHFVIAKIYVLVSHAYRLKGLYADSLEFSGNYLLLRNRLFDNQANNDYQNLYGCYLTADAFNPPCCNNIYCDLIISALHHKDIATATLYLKMIHFDESTLYLGDPTFLKEIQSLKDSLPV